MNTEQIRSEFESWCHSQGISTVRMKDDANVYGARTTEDLWRGWKAGQLSRGQCSFVPVTDISELSEGTIVRHRSGSEAYIVTGNYGGRATAVRTTDISNPAEWLRMV